MATLKFRGGMSNAELIRALNDVWAAANTVGTGTGLSAADQLKLTNIQAGATANATDVQLRDRTTHTGAQPILTITGLQTALDAKQASLSLKTINGVSIVGTGDLVVSGSGGLSGADRIKLDSIASGATVNSTDLALLNRANHTGAQAIATITGLQVALNNKQEVLASTVSIKTINGVSIMGAGDLVVGGAGLTTEERTKFNNIAIGATKNQTDAYLLARANHTGQQAVDSVVGLQVALDGKLANVGFKTINSQAITGSGNIVIAGTSGAGALEQALTFAPNVLWNANLGLRATLLLTGDATLTIPTNLVNGTYKLIVKQGPTGFHQLNYATGFTPRTIALSDQPNARTLIQWECMDGATLIGSVLYREVIDVVTPPTVPSTDAPSGISSTAWFDAEPYSRFQSSATITTAPAPATNIFGRWLDRSANGNNLVQTDDAKRGYVQSFDAGDRLSGYMQYGMSSAAGGSGTGDFYIALSFFLYGNEATLFSTVLGSNANTGLRIQRNGSQANDIVISAGTGSARVSVALSSGTPVNTTMSAAATVEAWRTGGQLVLRYNGSTPVTIACPTVAAGMVGFITGALDAIGTSAANMDLFQLVWKNDGVPNAATRDAVGAFCATKAGIGYGATAQPPDTTATTMPTTITTASLPVLWLQTGNPNDAYWVEDNRWGAQTITEGPGADQYMQEIGILPGATADGAIGARFRGRWPNPPGSGDVKSYPSVISGRKPGYYSTSNYVDGHPIRLPDGTNLQQAPSGHTPGTLLPVQLPIPALKGRTAYGHVVPPTGAGHLAYDIWLQNTAPQTSGFMAADISHEIMVPLTNWGNYGGHNVAGGRNPTWYDHDVTLAGRLWHVYCTKGADGILRSNFGKETPPNGIPIGWKMIAFVPDVFPIPQNEVLDLAALVNYVSTRYDIGGNRWATGNEHLVSVELGIEPNNGTFDMVIWNYKARPLVSNTTTGSTVVPVAPVGVTANGATGNSMTINWAPVASATSYNVYRGAVKVNAVAITANSYVNSGLAASTSYTWTVRAVNNVGEGPASAAVTASTTVAVVIPTGEAAISAAFAYAGGQNGAWFDFKAQYINAEFNNSASTVSVQDDPCGRIIDRSPNTNDIVIPIGTNRGGYDVSGARPGVFLYYGAPSTSGGGSGDTNSNGFYMCRSERLIVYTTMLWSDSTGPFNGRTVRFSGDTGGIVFSVGTGAARVTLAVNTLVPQYTSGGGLAVTWQAWQDATNIYLQVNNGPIVSTPCAACSPGSPNFSAPGIHPAPATPTVEGGTRVYYSVHTLNPLTADLRAEIKNHVATQMG